MHASCGRAAAHEADELSVKHEVNGGRRAGAYELWACGGSQSQ